MKIISKEKTRTINGGSITFLAVCEGLGTAYGIYEGGKLCVKAGIWLGNKIFKNNASYL